MIERKFWGLGLVFILAGGLSTAQAQQYQYSPVSVYRGSSSEPIQASRELPYFGPSEAPVPQTSAQRATYISSESISVPVNTAIYRTPVESANDGTIRGQAQPLNSAASGLDVDPVTFRYYRPYGYRSAYRPYYGYSYGYRPYYNSYYRPRAVYRPYRAYYGGYGYRGYSYPYYGASYGYGGGGYGYYGSSCW